MTDPLPTGTEAEACRLIAQRQQLGIAKYGVTVADNQLPASKWAEHAQQEAADQLVYLTRLKERTEELERLLGQMHEALEAALPYLASRAPAQWAKARAALRAFERVGREE